MTREEKALADAEQRDPGNPFVKRLREWYKDKGWLSEKQIAALAKIEPKLEFLKKKATGLFEKGKVNQSQLDRLLKTKSLSEFVSIWAQVELEIYIPYGQITPDNIEQHFPHMHSSLEPLSEYNPLNRNTSGAKRKFNLLSDIANGMINPSLEDLCGFEEEEERRHQGHRDWIESLHGEDIGDYDNGLDHSDFF